MDPAANPAPGDNPAASPAANPPAPAGDPAANNPTPGSEPDTNPSGGQDPAQVPSYRLREANEAKRAAEERAETLQAELDAAKQPQSTDDDDDDDIEPNVRNLVTKIIKKEGYVKEDQVQATIKANTQALERQRQYQQDTADLTTKYANTGVPFVPNDVRDYAKEHGINITNRASLEATYNVMNSDKILENARLAAIAEYKEGGSSSGEKPGSSGAQKPEEPQVRGLKNRIAAARSKLGT